MISLLDNGAKIDAQGRGGGWQGTALMTACCFGNEAIVRLLIENEADLNLRGSCFGNALQAACAGGNRVVVRLLLEQEADVNAEGGSFGSALKIAEMEERSGDLVELLLEHGPLKETRN